MCAVRVCLSEPAWSSLLSPFLEPSSLEGDKGRGRAGAGGMDTTPLRLLHAVLQERQLSPAYQRNKDDT